MAPVRVLIIEDDSRLADALARLPDYLGNHVLVSVTSLALGLAVSLPLAFLAMRRPALRGPLLAAASVVQTIPGLALLVERAGRVVTRYEIFDEVWDGETDLRSNAIDVHVANLRAKIGRERIETVRGVGFRLAESV